MRKFVDLLLRYVKPQSAGPRCVARRLTFYISNPIARFFERHNEERRSLNAAMSQAKWERDWQARRQKRLNKFCAGLDTTSGTSPQVIDRGSKHNEDHQWPSVPDTGQISIVFDRLEFTSSL